MEHNVQNYINGILELLVYKSKKNTQMVIFKQKRTGIVDTGEDRNGLRTTAFQRMPLSSIVTFTWGVAQCFSPPVA